MSATHPLDLSDQIIDSGVAHEPPNRITQELSELGDGVAMVESFSHVIVVDTGDGLVAFDSSSSGTGDAVVASMRGWSQDRLHSLVYTHGHLDHVGGSRCFAAAANERGDEAPRVFGHSRVNDRLERYRDTDGYNRTINLRQFGGVPKSPVGKVGMGAGRSFVPDGTLAVDDEHVAGRTEQIGDVTLEHHHALGETDDHTWTWIPERKMVTAGDLFIWNFPNCGNPQKVQRYPLEWARALRAMAAKQPELLAPAHGLPIRGADRIAAVLDVVASTLEDLVREVIDAMNTGASLDAIQQTVSVDPSLLELPYLRPLYDEPEFVVCNIWRLYGGWWDGNAARLKPPSDAAIGREIVALAGSTETLVLRAEEAATAGELRVACQLIEYAAAAEPESHRVHEARAAIYAARRKSETSLMAKGIFAAARAESQMVIGEEVQRQSLRDSVDESIGKPD